MGLYGAFSSSVMGMMSQSYAMGIIGSNIANVSTGGFKGSEARFSTVLSDTLFNQSDLGGVTPHQFQRINHQGLLEASHSNYDLGINGQGFFMLSTQFDGSGETFYGRDGSFQMRTVNDVAVTGDDGTPITVRDGYLADKNGYFVLGYGRNADGTFPTSGGTLAPMRIDPYAFIDQFEATTTAQLDLNLPSQVEAGHLETYAVTMVDSAGTAQDVRFNFTKTATLNEWEFSTTTSQDPVAQVDAVTLGGTVEAGDVYSVTINGTIISYTVTGGEAGIDGVRDALVSAINSHPSAGSIVTAAAGGAGGLTLTANVAGSALTTSVSATNNGGTADNTASVSTTVANVPNTVTTPVTTLVFGSKGELISAPTLPLALTFAGGTSAALNLDIEGSTQFGGDFLPINYQHNGYARANMEKFYFDDAGYVIGVFDDSTVRQMYRVPLAVFSNANALEAQNGNVFSATRESGTARVALAGVHGYARFLPNSRELSDVDLAEEFTVMIMTQQAYTSSSTVFKTVDEMTEVARDLKR